MSVCVCACACGVCVWGWGEVGEGGSLVNGRVCKIVREGVIRGGAGWRSGQW